MDEYLKKPCERCGSEKRVLKTWLEDVKTFNGSIKVKHTQIICTNKECQRVFDQDLAVEVKKRADIRLKKEENDKKRKDDFLIRSSKAKLLKAAKA